MFEELDQATVESDLYDVDGIGKVLIEAIWHELDEQLPRERVSCVVTEVGRGYQNATVKTFVPILVHRQTVERLRQELEEMAPIDDHSFDEH